MAIAYQSDLFAHVNSLFKVDTNPILQASKKPSKALLEQSLDHLKTKQTLTQAPGSIFVSKPVISFERLAGRTFKDSGLEISKEINIKASDDNPRIAEMKAIKFQIDENNSLVLSPTGANPLQLKLNGVDVINSPVKFNYENNSGSFSSGKFSPTSVGGAPVMVSLGRVTGSKLNLPDGQGGFKEKSLADFIQKEESASYPRVNTKASSDEQELDNICHCSTLYNDFKLENFSTKFNGQGEFKITLSLDLKKDEFLKELLKDEKSEGKLSVTYTIFKNKETGRYNFSADMKLTGDVNAGATGSHLYLNAPENTSLTVPASKIIETNDHGEALSEPVDIDDANKKLDQGRKFVQGDNFDDTYTGLKYDDDNWARSRLEYSDGSQILMRQTMTAPFLQVFNNKGEPNSNGERYICLEPLGGAPDSINQSSMGKNHMNPVITSEGNPFRMAYELDAVAAS